MKFDRYIPKEILRPYVRYFAISEETDEKTYKVLPETSLVLGFQYRGALYHSDHEEESPLAISGVTGLRDTFRIFRNSKNIGTVLVYFTETGASHFFKNPLNELFSESISLGSFIPRSVLDQTEEQLAEAETDLQRIAVVEQFLLSQMRFSSEDLLVRNAIGQILQSNGNIRVKELAANLNISQSPLEKRFRKVVGATPKKFASIIRLQNLIKGYSKTQSLTEAGYMAGYFDQSHFIKDFKLFTGEVPEKYFSTHLV